jgi:DNA-binding CsgD family transcriptional regulator
MAEFLADSLEVSFELAGIASAPSTIEQRAEALLGQLSRLVPFQAARIGLLDPERGAPVSLVSQGYNEAVRAYYDSPAVLEEFELLGLDRARLPICIRDLPVPAGEVRGWAEYLRPAGFREGLAVGLFTPDGRHLGILGMNTDTEAHPTDAARNLIGQLASLIAYAVDPLRSIVAAARLIHDATAGIALARTGNPLPVPGMSTHPLLSQNSLVLAVVAQQLPGGPHYASFLCPYSTRENPDSHVRVTVLACLPQPACHLAAVVMVSPPGNLCKLTPRELEILGLLVEGWPNQRIAAAFGITARTVAARVEHILVKLDARTRALAAVRALNRGLYVPYPLARAAGDHVSPQNQAAGTCNHPKRGG